MDSGSTAQRCYILLIQIQLTLHNNLTSLVTVAMSDKPSLSHYTHVLTQWKLHRGAMSKNQQFSSLSPPKLIYSPVLFVYQTKWRIRRYDWSDRLSVKIFVKGQLRVLLLLFDGAIASPYTQACGATVWKVRHVYSCRPGQQHIWFNGIYIWRKLYRPLEYWG